jgi:zinc transporter ZupT
MGPDCTSNYVWWISACGEFVQSLQKCVWWILAVWWISTAPHVILNMRTSCALRALLGATILAAALAAEDDHHDEHDDDHASPPWGPALGAAAIVNMVTLLGVAALGVPMMRQWRVQAQAITYSSGFAAGALLSACFFLMLPESILLISTADYRGGDDDHAEDEHDEHRRRQAEEEHEEEHTDLIPVDVIWRWGACVLAGFALVVVIDLFLSALSKDPKATAEKTQERNSATELDVNLSDLSPKSPKDEMVIDKDPKAAADKINVEIEKIDAHTRRRVLASVLVGDTLHNFADGVFIGTAFLTCDPSVGWAVTVGTVAHEISQEVADFFLLTTVCGLRVPHALLANFLSGTTVFIGVALVLSSDLSEAGVGMIIAAGGGLYLYNATVECMPRVLHARELRHKCIALALFALGAIAIGLVLVDHQHCEHADRR